MPEKHALLTQANMEVMVLLLRYYTAACWRHATVGVPEEWILPAVRTVR